MQIILLDGGGTALKSYYYNDNKILIEKFFGSANISNNFELTKNNLIEAINFYKEKLQINFEKTNILIALAGAYSNPHLVIKMNKEIKNLFNNKVLFTSDIIYHYSKYFLNNNGIVINLGTGTSIFELKNNTKNLLYGFGKNFLEPSNGYSIGLNILKYLSNLEMNDSKSPLYQKFINDYNLKSIRMETSKINNASVQEIASYTKWLFEIDHHHGDLYNEIQKIIHLSFLEIFEYLKINKNFEIYFVGKISTNKLVQKMLNKYHSNLKFNKVPKYLIEEIWNMLLE